MMRFLLVLFLAVNVFFFSSCKSPEEAEKGFKVDGTDLLDPNGNPFVIRGVNNPHIWYLNGPYEALDTLAGLNVNCVRIVWETRGKVDSLERAVSRCIELGMIPMVELHDATGDTSLHQLMKLVRYYTRPDVRSTLKAYEQYLLMNIANEWGDHYVSSEKWRNYYQIAIDSLRQAGYQYTIVIDAPGWGQNLQPILDYSHSLIDHDPQHNLLFSIHMYGSWNDTEKIRNDLTTAHRAGIPLIVGEFGYDFQDGDNNLGCRVDHQMILNTCEELNYGYLAWSWTGNNEENAWLDLAEISDWQTLTWWGEEIFMGENGIMKTAQPATIFTSRKP